MRIRRNLCAAVCEADGCQKRAEYRLEFGDDLWLSVHLCPDCLKKLGKGIVRFVERREQGTGCRGFSQDLSGGDDSAAKPAE